MKLHLITMSLAAVIALVGCGSTTEDNSNATTQNSSEQPVTLPSGGDVRSFEEANIGIEDNINIDETNKEDVFEIHLTADNYTIYSELLTGTEDGGEMKMTIYDPNGSVILEFDTGYGEGSWARETFEVKADGLYTVKVGDSPYSSEAVYRFKLFHSIEGGLIQDNQNERNDNKYMATPISFQQGAKTVGNLNISRDSDNEDWYSVELTPDTYTFYSNLLAGTQYEVGSRTTTLATVYSPDGIKVLNEKVGYREGEWVSQSFEAKVEGSYLIQMRADTLHSDMVYDFSLYPSKSGGLSQDSSGERNDNEHMATPITLSGVNSGLSGDINIQRVSDTHDWYKVTLPSGTYSVDYSLLTGTEHTVQFQRIYFNIYDPSGVKVLNDYSSAIAGKSYSSEFTANQSGEYLIEISNSGDMPNVYEFSITQ